MYQVFISFKKTVPGTKNELTKEFTIASELFNFLEENGYKNQVFFSEHELEETGSSDFSDKIDQGLEESRVLVLICDNPDYLHDGWVKDEWSTFTGEIKSKRKNGTVFCLNTDGLDMGKVPVGLRKYSFFTYPDGMSHLLNYINNYLEEKNELLLMSWNKAKKEKYYEYSNFSYIRESFAEFIDAEYFLGDFNIYKVIYDDRQSFTMCLLNEVLELDEEERNVFFLDSLSEISTLETGTDLSEYEDLNIFVSSVDDVNELHYLSSFIEKYPSAKVLVGVYHRNSAVNKSSLLANAPMHRFDKLSIDEVRDFTDFFSRRTGIRVPRKFLFYLMTSSLSDLRTPLLLKSIYSSMSETEDYLATDYNITDVFDAIDHGLSNEMVEFVNKILALMKEKQNYKVLKNSIDINVDDLDTGGLFTKEGAFLYFSSKTYFNYKIAELIFGEYGHEVKEDEFKIFKNALPYYIYLYYLEFNELVALSSLGKDGKMVLIDLLVSEKEALKEIILNDEFKCLLVPFIYKSRMNGLFLTANKIIEVLEECGVPSTEECDYLSEKFMIHYSLTGSVLETDYNLGNMSYYRAYIAFCQDDYETALRLFDESYNKMFSSGEINISLSIDYCELLVDWGDSEKLNDIVSLLESYNDQLTVIEKEKFLRMKAIIAGDNNHFDEAIDLTNQGIELSLVDGDMGLLEIFYGDMGAFNMYEGNYEEAKKYLNMNLNLALREKNLNGIAISSKLLGKIYFLNKDYEQAYKFFSLAETFAQEAGNVWRLTKIRMYLSLLTKDQNIVEEYKTAIKVIQTPVFLYDYYILNGFILKGHGKEKEALESFKEAYKQASLTNSLRSKQRAAYYLGIETDAGSLTNYLKDFMDACNSLTIDKRVAPLPLDFFRYNSLKTERLVLRGLGYKDAPDIFTYTSNIMNTRFVLWKRHTSLADTYEYITGLYSIDNIGYMYTWAITLNDKAIGTIDLSYNDTYKEIELGYILNMKYWHKGYAFEAAKAVLEFAKNIGVKRIIGLCFTVNAASKGLLEKLGFKFIKTIDNYHNVPSISDKTGLYYELDLR